VLHAKFDASNGTQIIAIEADEAAHHRLISNKKLGLEPELCTYGTATQFSADIKEAYPSDYQLLDGVVINGEYPSLLDEAVATWELLKNGRHMVLIVPPLLCGHDYEKGTAENRLAVDALGEFYHQYRPRMYIVPSHHYDATNYRGDVEMWVFTKPGQQEVGHVG
jgi:hypothetical protein